MSVHTADCYKTTNDNATILMKNLRLDDGNLIVDYLDRWITVLLERVN